MASKAKHIKTLQAQMEALGTWRPEYMVTVEVCAKIMERRDQLLKQYKAEGNVAKTADGKKSPTLQALESNERDLLSYFRALGLTPDTIKRMEKNRKTAAEETPMDAMTALLMGRDGD